MQFTILTLLTTTTLALAAAIPEPQLQTLKVRAEPLSIPPACTVCDALGVACVAACLAGGPADPLCDICAGGALGIVTQCLTVRDLFHILGHQRLANPLIVSCG